MEEEEATPKHDVVEPSPEAELIPSDVASEPHRPVVEDSALDLLPSSSISHNSEPARAPPTSHAPPTSSLLSGSLQTHEELSNELSRMATQLKRNAQHFSESLDKDKSLVQSAADVLEKNYDTMTKERVRLRDHRGKSFGTTWMVFGALLVVSIAWVCMFFIIRFT
jgi:Membrane fusion protein Use1